MTNILYFRTYRSYGHFPYKIVDHVTRSILLCDGYGHMGTRLVSGHVDVTSECETFGGEP